MEYTGRIPSPGAARVALRSQWEAFQGGRTIVTGVRPEIAASWRRSAAAELRAELPAAPVDEAVLRGFESMPTHSGRERFAGHSFHSARWDHDYELRGKRVAVVGNGASAVQFVPQIAPGTARLSVFSGPPTG